MYLAPLRIKSVNLPPRFVNPAFAPKAIDKPTKIALLPPNF